MSRGDTEQKTEEGVGLSVEDFCSLADQFATQGRLEEAVTLYEKAIKLYPQNLALKINLGRMRNLRNEREEEERRSLMDKFAGERSRRDRLAFQFESMGGIFEAQGREDRSIECLRLSVLNNPENRSARMGMARAHYRNNDFASCIRELRSILAIDPFEAEAHALLGRALFYLKNYRAALNSIVDGMILHHAAGLESPPELQEKFKYLLDRLNVKTRTDRNDLVKSRLDLFNKCVRYLDLEKEAILGREAIRDLKDLVKPTIGEKERQDILSVALRLRAFELVGDLSDESVFRLAKVVREMHAAAGDLIFDEKNVTDELFLVEKGRVRVQKTTPFGDQPLAEMKKGDFFGEMNFIDPSTRSAEAKAVIDTDLLVLKRSDLEMLFDTRKEVAVQFYWNFWKSLARRTREANNLLKTFFNEPGAQEARPADKGQADQSKAISIDLDRKLKLLQERGLSAKELRLLAAFSSEELYNANELIFREGDAGDILYIILDGKVRISKHIPGVGDEALAILDKGDFFGEMALIDNEPRSADASAHVNGTTVLTISRQVLNEILSVDMESAYQFLSILCRILTQRLREINLKIIQWRLMAGGF
ncbi:MAG: cyclic nucleotide-binding domain-containing protein [Acidobacteriota bacterium]